MRGFSGEYRIRSLRGVAALLLAIGSGCLAGAAQTEPAPGSDPAGALRLSRVAVPDPVAGCDAFSILLPPDWKTDGGPLWRPYLSNQAAVMWRASGPADGVSLNILPCDPFVWNSADIPFFNEGVNYLGSEVRRPVQEDVSAFITNTVLPRYRPDIEQVRVTAVTPLPAIAEATVAARAEAGVRKQGAAARVRVEYSKNGQAMQEDFFCVLLYSTPLHAPSLTFWGPDNLYSFRARTGRLDAHEGVLRTLVASQRISPDWFNIVVQLQQMFIDGRMQSIRDAGQVSAIIAGTNREISAMIRTSYEAREVSNDRINQLFIDAMRED